MPLDTRIAFLVQEHMFLMRYPLTVRFGSDEHDRNMLASACSAYIGRHKDGRLIDADILWSLESDVAAFLAGGAVMRRRNADARRLAWSMANNPLADGRAARNLAEAYRPAGLP